MPSDYAEYNENGIYFAYPSNWSVQNSILNETEKDVTQDDLLIEDVAETITVTDPYGSFWMLAIYPGGTCADTAAKKILKTMMSEYKKLENEPIKKYIADRILHGYEMHFVFLVLTSTALVLGFEENDKTYIVYWQTCDRLAITDENICCEDVFEAITHTFLENLNNEKKKTSPETE